jgi:hypothetical protein
VTDTTNTSKDMAVTTDISLRNGYDDHMSSLTTGAPLLCSNGFESTYLGTLWLVAKSRGNPFDPWRMRWAIIFVCIY